MPEAKVEVIVFLTGLLESCSPPKIKVGRYEFRKSYAHDNRLILDGHPVSRKAFNEISEDLYKTFSEWNTHQYAVEIMQPVIQASKDDFPNLTKARSVLDRKRRANKNSTTRKG